MQRREKTALFPDFVRCLSGLVVVALLLSFTVITAEAKEQSKKYFTQKTVTLPQGATVQELTINGPPKPPPGFEVQRQAVQLPVPNKEMGISTLQVPAFNWVFGCSAVSGAMIAGYYDRNGFDNMYTGPTNGGIMPLDNSSWPYWTDVSMAMYPNCPLIASHNGVDGRATRGSIDDYWIQYGSTASDPYITNGWTQHTWEDAIGDYMKTSQSAYANSDGSTVFYTWASGAAPLTCADMDRLVITRDGTLGRKQFYEARGYAVTDCYNQYTDNIVAGGFSFAQYKAEIDAGRPVLLNLAGHSIVGIGYDDSSNTVYIHDTWDYLTHTMTWGTSYAGMELRFVSIVNVNAGMTYTVTFESNGGSAVPAQKVPENGKVNKPADPTKPGYSFAGWYSDIALTTLFDFNTPITSDVTLYARWTAGYTVSGIVHDGSPTGAPLAGVTVAMGGKAATTDASGAFIISGLAAGTYTVTLSKTGYATKTVTGFVVSGDLSGVVFYLSPTYYLNGTVRQGSATGPVLPGATVSIAGKTATTSSTGTFSITGIPQGTYTLTISKTGYVTKTFTGYVIDRNIDGAWYYLFPSGYTLSGTVRQGSSTGPVLPGATVAIAGKSALTSSTGTFTVTGIPAGTYTVTISKSGYVTKAVTGFVISGNRSGVVFYLSPAYSLSGTVRQGSSTGPVLPGATVSIAGKTATTSSTGTFSISGIPAGTYTLTISKTGFVTKTVTGYVINSNRSGQVFYLTAASYSISGTVRQGSTTGAVLPGATVSIAGKTALTSSTGAFSITGIPAGSYTLTISKTGYVTKRYYGYVINSNKSGLVFYLVRSS